MICVSIANISFDECLTLLRKQEPEMAEIRLDQLDFTPEEVTTLFALPHIFIATHRPGDIDETERRQSLIAAINAGAAYVDLEVESDPDFIERVIMAARKNCSRIIISYHNYDDTPPKDELENIVAECFKMGGQIAKIACQVNKPADAARLLSLYDAPNAENKRLVAVGMGRLGKITRAAIPLLGAPFTFASMGAGKETAPGQMDTHKLETIYKYL